MKRMFTFAALAAALLVVGCGSSSKSSSSSSSASTPAATPTTSSTPTTASGGSSGGASTHLALAADPGGALKFNKKALAAKAGNVTITMANPSSVPHGVGVSGNGIDKDGPVVNKGGNSTITVSLKPGKYTFYCPVPGHKQAGMMGVLLVK